MYEHNIAQAEVIESRLNDAGKQCEFYVHYENFNRRLQHLPISRINIFAMLAIRLDEWVPRDRIMVETSSYDGLEQVLKPHLFQARTSR